MWNCGRGDTHFSEIFCVCVEIKNGLKLGVVQQFVCVDIPLCVDWV